MLNTAASAANIGSILILMHHTPVTNLLLEELIQIQPHHLHLLANPQVQEGDVLERIQQDARNHKRVTSHRADLRELVPDLDAVAVHGAEGIVRAHAVEIVDPGLGEEARQERADHAADAVELEDVHAFVDLDPFVEVVAERADGAGQEADQRGEPDGDVASGGRDADEAGDGARAGADDGEVALGADVVDKDPAEDAEGGGGVGVKGGQHGADCAVEGGTAVEAEPAEPDKDGADEDESGVVSAAVNLLALGQALAEDEGVREGRPA